MKPTPRIRKPSRKVTAESPKPILRIRSSAANTNQAISNPAARQSSRSRGATTNEAISTPGPKPNTRSRNTKTKAPTSTLQLMTRTRSGQAEPKQQHLTVTAKGSTATPNSQLVSPPFTPTTSPATDDSVDKPSELSRITTEMDTGAVAPPQWMLTMQRLQIPTLAGLSTPLTVPTKSYTEPILGLPRHVRHRIFNFAFDDEGQTTLSVFGDYQTWKAPAILLLNPHFLEDGLPVFLHETTLVIHRGDEFSAANVLSAGATRSAVEKLDFPRAYLNGTDDLRIFEIMRACPSLREVTLDICVDHLLTPTLDEEGDTVNWESTAFSVVDKLYSLHVIAHLPNLTVLKYRLVGDCVGWKRRLVQPVLDEIATFLLQFTSGRLVLESLGWWGRREIGYGSRMPTVRGDGLGLAKTKSEVMAKIESEDLAEIKSEDLAEIKSKDLTEIKSEDMAEVKLEDLAEIKSEDMDCSA